MKTINVKTLAKNLAYVLEMGDTNLLASLVNSLAMESNLVGGITSEVLQTLQSHIEIVCERKIKRNA